VADPTPPPAEVDAATVPLPAKPADATKPAAAAPTGAADALPSEDKSVDKVADTATAKPEGATVATDATAPRVSEFELDVAPDPTPPPPKRPPSEPPPPTSRRGGKRLTGDELLGDLFDAMGDLYFLASTLEGANFVLSLAMDKIPCTYGVVHFFDIDKREFIVSRAIGSSADLLTTRTPAREGLAAEVMNKRRAVVIADAGAQAKPFAHWERLGGKVKSAVVAPVALGGRWMGMLELVNPKDGKPFVEGDGYALSYMAEQFAEFLGQRGLVIDPDVIRAYRSR